MTALHTSWLLEIHEVVTWNGFELTDVSGSIQGKKDQELPQIQRRSSYSTSLRNDQWTTPQIRAHTNASQRSTNRHISTSTVLIRPSCLNCYKENHDWRRPTRRKLLGPRNTRKDKWDGGIRRDISMCCSHSDAWRMRCDVVRVLCWWHCCWFT